MNRIKFLSKIALAASVSLALAFTFSCSSDDIEESGSPVTGGADGGGNQFSQVYYAHCDEHDVFHIGEAYKGSGDIKIALYDESWKKTLVNAGSVTNGIVRLNLPKNIPNEYFLEAFPDDCTVSPQDIKYARTGGFELTNNNNYVGDLGIGWETIDLWDEGITYRYFSKAGKITCNYYEEHGDKIITNIDAKAGWNKIYRRSSSYYDTFEESTNNILTKDMKKWVLINGC